jgi:hypothetical protein
MSWRVTYVDLEGYAAGRPPQFSLIMIKQPEGYDDQADPSDLPAAALDALRTWLVGAPTALHVRPSEAVQEPAKCKHRVIVGEFCSACDMYDEPASAEPKCACPPGGQFVLDTCPIHGDSAYRAWPLANPDRVQAIIERLSDRDALPDTDTEEDTQS